MNEKSKGVNRRLIPYAGQEPDPPPFRAADLVRRARALFRHGNDTVQIGAALGCSEADAERLLREEAWL